VLMVGLGVVTPRSALGSPAELEGSLFGGAARLSQVNLPLPAAGASFLLRHDGLMVGLGGEGDTLLLVSTAQFEGLAGVNVRLGSCRLDLLGSLGYRYYPSWGASFLGGDPGVTTSIPFAGARLRALREWRHEDGSATLFGASVGWEDDLERRYFEYTYTADDWFSGEEYTSTGKHWLGGTAVLLGVTLAWTVPLQ
jgi:hypothetical protein